MLIHIDLHAGAATSKTIGAMLDTNPVFVRRMLRGLRERGYVEATKGPGGGWRMARPLSKITLKDVHDALGSSPLIGITVAHDHPSCPVERAVTKGLGLLIEGASKSLLKQLANVSVAEFAPTLPSVDDGKRSLKG